MWGSGEEIAEAEPSAFCKGLAKWEDNAEEEDLAKREDNAGHRRGFVGFWLLCSIHQGSGDQTMSWGRDEAGELSESRIIMGEHHLSS